MFHSDDRLQHHITVLNASLSNNEVKCILIKQNSLIKTLLRLFIVPFFINGYCAVFLFFISYIINDKISRSIENKEGIVVPDVPFLEWCIRIHHALLS